MSIFFGCVLGVIAWFLTRYLIGGLYTVDQNERAVKTSFGRADRIPDQTTLNDPIAEHLSDDERERYAYPQVRVIPPGGPYFKWPWEKVYKVSVATQTLSMAYDPESPSANNEGQYLEAVTKDQLNTGMTGQLRYRVAERNLYAYLFGVKHPVSHVMGYFVSVLRERIANFEAPKVAVAEGDAVAASAVTGGIAWSAHESAGQKCSGSTGFCADPTGVSDASRARTFAWVSTVTLGAGVIAGVVAFALPRNERVTVGAIPGGGAISLEGTWR